MLLLICRVITNSGVFSLQSEAPYGPQHTWRAHERELFVAKSALIKIAKPGR